MVIRNVAISVLRYILSESHFNVITYNGYTAPWSHLGVATYRARIPFQCYFITGYWTGKPLQYSNTYRVGIQILSNFRCHTRKPFKCYATQLLPESHFNVELCLASKPFKCYCKSMLIGKPFQCHDTSILQRSHFSERHSWDEKPFYCHDTPHREALSMLCIPCLLVRAVKANTIFPRANHTKTILWATTTLSYVTRHQEIKPKLLNWHLGIYFAFCVKTKANISFKLSVPTTSTRFLFH